MSAPAVEARVVGGASPDPRLADDANADQEVEMPENVERGLFTRVLWERIFRHQKNAVVVVSGESGSGKSWTGLRLCQTLDPEFDAENVFFDPEDLIRAIARQKKRRGRWRIFDEAGVGVHNRDWHDLTNKSLIHMMQTWRVFGEGIVLTVPYLSYLDAQVFRMCQYWVEMSSTMKGVGIVKKIVVREDMKGRPIHYPFLRTSLPDGRRVKVSPVIFSAPSTPLVKAYEKKEWAFKGDLGTKLEVGLKQERHDTDRRSYLQSLIKETIEAMRRDKDLYRKTLKKGGTRLDRGLMKSRLGLTAADAEVVFAEVRDAFGF